MKKLFILALIMPLFLCACVSEEQNGYPKKVTFTKNGGTKIVYGDDYICGLSIGINGDEIGGTDTEDSIFVSNRWLSAKCGRFGKELTIAAEPSEEKKKRKFYIYVDFGPEYAVIKVEQE